MCDGGIWYRSGFLFNPENPNGVPSFVTPQLRRIAVSGLIGIESIFRQSHVPLMDRFPRVRQPLARDPQNSRGSPVPAEPPVQELKPKRPPIIFPKSSRLPFGRFVRPETAMIRPRKTTLRGILTATSLLWLAEAQAQLPNDLPKTGVPPGTPAPGGSKLDLQKIRKGESPFGASATPGAPGAARGAAPAGGVADVRVPHKGDVAGQVIEGALSVCGVGMQRRYAAPSHAVS